MRLAFQDSIAYLPERFHPAVYHPGFGLGDDNSSDNNKSPWASLPGAAVTGASTATILGGSVKADIVGGIQAGVLAAAPFTGPAAPFVLAVGALIGPIATMFKGCGASCTQTTEIANAVASATGQITAKYWASPVRTITMQQTAIQALQQLYGYLISNCQKIGGQGGSQCVKDRQPGGVWDYQAQQIAPIQNDAEVIPDPVQPGSMGAALSNIPTPLLFGGAALLLYMFIGGSN